MDKPQDDVTKFKPVEKPEPTNKIVYGLTGTIIGVVLGTIATVGVTGVMNFFMSGKRKTSKADILDGALLGGVVGGLGGYSNALLKDASSVIKVQQEVIGDQNDAISMLAKREALGKDWQDRLDGEDKSESIGRS